MKIYSIARGFVRVDVPTKAQKKHKESLLRSKPQPRAMVKGHGIVFTWKDNQFIGKSHEVPKVISTLILNLEVEKVLIDPRSLSNIMLSTCLTLLGFEHDDLVPIMIELVNFSGA